MINDKNQNNEESSFISSDDEIDLKPIFSFFFRNKYFLSIFSFGFFLLFYLYSFTVPKVWEGQFQIVLSIGEKSKPSLFEFSPILRNVSGLSQKNNLKTEVGILKSSSILKPIYEFAISNYKTNNKNIKSFTNWKKNLKIQLEKGTTILNITYRDEDKKNIIPVLNRMTSSYQDYSGRNTRRANELKKDYVTKQIILFKQKSSNSLKKVQEFAIDQDLLFLDIKNNQFSLSQDNLIGKSQTKNFGRKNVNEREVPSLLIPNINIETIRVKAANDIRQINLQIQKIKELNNAEELQYIGSTIPALVAEGLPEALKKIDESLVELSSKYTEEDRTIVRLLEKREITKEFLKERAINYLKAAKIEAESRMQAAMRPKGVLLKYKELIREAQRDENALISLENQLMAIKLDAAKVEDPWELITKPTLVDYPVSQSKIIISTIGLLIGASLGTFIAVLKERKSGKIFSKEALEKELLVPFIETINLQSNNKDLFYLKEFLSRKSFNNLSFVFVAINDDFLISQFQELVLNDPKLNKNAICFRSLDEISNENNTIDIILITSINQIRFSEIQVLKKRIKILDQNLKGFILIEDYS